jgi:cytochrome P450
MLDLAKRDYFTDPEIGADPFAYFEALRALGPVHRLENGIVMVTGFEEGLDVLRNTRDFSSLISSQGPSAVLPFTPEGSDITAQIEAHRDQVPTGRMVVTYDDDRHASLRALLTPLFTPSRLKAIEEFIAGYSDGLVRSAVARGRCELIGEVLAPFVTMVIADLLAVPAQDRDLFTHMLDAGPQVGSFDTEELARQGSAMVKMNDYFRDYVVDRRRRPSDDVLSDLANARFPDGTAPEVEDIVDIATFLFAAGADSSAKLLGTAMRFIVGEPGLQARLRADPSLIPALLEEALRIDCPIKMGARLARRDTRVGDLAVPAGTRLMVAFPAANRDPRRWENPTAFVLDRPRIKEHLGFSRGAHACIGAQVARTEGRIILEKFLQYTAHIAIDRGRHPQGVGDLAYEPSFIMRGVSEMHLTLEISSD